MANEGRADSDQLESEGAGSGQNPTVVISQQLRSAFVWLGAPIATFAGLVAVSAEFAKTAKMQIILACVLLASLPLLVVVLKELRKRCRKKISWPLGLLVGIVTVALIAGACAGVGINRFLAQSRSSASVIAFRPPVPCSKPLSITSPAKDEKIAGRKGVKVKITACGLTAGESGWLFDVDGGDGTYGLDSGGAVITGNGTTTFDDTPIGDPGDVNEHMKIALVLANPACVEAMNQIDIQDTYPKSLPASCRIASQVEVIESY